MSAKDSVLLLLVQFQRDFFPGGTVALQHAKDVLDTANDLIHSGFFDHIVATTLIHHPCHATLEGNNPGRTAHDSLTSATFDDNSTIILPDYCMMGSRGAELHPDLDLPSTASVVSCVVQPGSDNFAVLTPDPETERNLLRDLIGTINPRAVYVAGMPLELGVRAIALELGLIVPAVFIVEDACCAIFPDRLAGSLHDLEWEGIAVCDTKDERLRSLQQRPVTAEDEFSLSRDVVPIQYTYAAPQYSAAPTPSVQRSPTVDLLLKSFDGDNQRRDSATVSMQLGLSVSQRASEDSAANPRDNLSLPQLVRKIVLTASYGDWKHVDNCLRRYGVFAVNICMFPSGWNALHIAVCKGDEEMVRGLIAAGARPNQAADADGWTPLMLACKYQHVNVVKVLIVQLRKAEVLSAALMATDDSFGMTALMWACVNCDAASVKVLLDAAQSVNETLRRKVLHKRSKFGMTAVMFAAAVLPASNARYDNCAEVCESPVGKAAPALRGAATSTPPTRPSSRGLGRRGVPEALLTPPSSGSSSSMRLRSPFAWQSELTPRVGVFSSPTAVDMRPAAAACIAELLQWSELPQSRLDLLRCQDYQGWTSLHYAARSGLFGGLPWHLLGSQLTHVPINLRTQSGLSILQLCLWNQHASSVNMILGDWSDAIQERIANPWVRRITFNEAKTLACGKHGELDLALMRNQINCARILVRRAVSALSLAGSRCSEFVYRLVLLGDGVAAEAVLRDPGNGVVVSSELVEATRRMTFVEACTFTFAQYHNPIRQWMYYCVTCKQRVCIVCRDRCHPEDTTAVDMELIKGNRDAQDLSSPVVGGTLSTMRSHRSLKGATVTASDANLLGSPLQKQTSSHHVVSLGLVSDAYCSCNKATCCVLPSQNSREFAGYKYVPTPVDVAKTPVVLPSAQLDATVLVNGLSEAMHDSWAATRMSSGWKPGRKRSSVEKTHPNLVPFSTLSASAQENVRNTVVDLLKTVNAIGYCVVKGSGPESGVVKPAATKAPAAQRNEDFPPLAVGKPAPGAKLAAIRPTSKLARQAVLSSPETSPNAANDSVGEASVMTEHSPDGVSDTVQALTELRRLSGGGRYKRKSDKGEQSSKVGGPLQSLLSPLLPGATGAVTPVKIDNDTSEVITDPSPIPMQPLSVEPPSTTSPPPQLAYQPKSFANADTPLPENVAHVALLLAKNSHDQWAKAQMNAGYEYAPKIVPGKKTSNMLVPWEHLTPQETAPRTEFASTFCRAVLQLGYAIRIQAGLTAPEYLHLQYMRTGSSATSGTGKAEVFRTPNRASVVVPEHAGNRSRAAQLRWFKQGLLNAFMFSVARVGNHELLRLLLHDVLCAQVQCVDHKGRSALFIAVQFRHVDTVKALVELGAEVGWRDVNGTCPLTVAAYIGDVKMCETLLSLGADAISFDVVGLTPLHYAALAGQALICDLLCRRLLLKGRNIDELVKPSHSSLAAVTSAATSNVRQMRAAVRNVQRQLDAHSQALQMAVIDKWRAQRVLGEAADSPLGTTRDDDDSWNDLLVGLGTPLEDVDTVSPLQPRQPTRFPSRKPAVGGVSMFLIAHDISAQRQPTSQTPPARPPSQSQLAMDMTFTATGAVPRVLSKPSQALGVSAASLTSQSRNTGIPSALSKRSLKFSSNSKSDVSAAVKSTLPRMEGFTVDTFALVQSFQTGNRLAGPPVLAELASSRDSPPDGPGTDRSAVSSRPPSLKIPGATLPSSKHLERRFSYGKLLYGADNPSTPKQHSLRRLPVNGDRLEAVTEDQESKHGTGKKRLSDDLIHDLSSPMLSPGNDLVSPHSNLMLSPSTGQSQRPLMSPVTVAAVSPSEDHKDRDSSFSKDSLEENMIDDDYDSDGAEDVDTTYPYISPLSIAVHAGHIETVEVLRRNGCDATRVDESTISPYERGLLRLAVAHAHRRNLKKTFFAHNGLVLLDETTKVSSAPVSPSNVASTATDAKPHTQKGDQMWKHVRKSFVGKAGPPDKPPEFRAQKSENSDAKPGIAPKTGLLRNLVGAGRRASIRLSDAFAAGLPRNMDDVHEQKLADATRSVESASDMLGALAEDKYVKAQRRRFAWTVLVREAAAYVAVLLVFLMILPTASDFDSNGLASFRLLSQTKLDASFVSQIEVMDDWFQWMGKHILWLPNEELNLKYGHVYQRQLSSSSSSGLVDSPVVTMGFDPVVICKGTDDEQPSIFQPKNTTRGERMSLFGSNEVVGSIRLRIVSGGEHECSADSSQTCYSKTPLESSQSWYDIFFTQQQPLGYFVGVLDEDVDVGQVFDLDSSNVTARRRVFEKIEEWYNPGVRVMAFDFTVLNLELDALCVFRLVVVYPPSGSLFAGVRIKALMREPNRFAASTTFELISMGLVLLQLVMLFNEYKSSVSLKAFFRDGWVWLDIAMVTIFVAMILTDIFAQNSAADFDRSFHDPTLFLNLWKEVQVLRNTLDLASIILIILTIRIIKVLRFVPGWGPMLIAVVLTWRDRIVLLYLTILVGLTAGFSTAFVVAFGQEDPNFSTFPRALLSLLRIGLAQDWFRFDSGYPRLLRVTLFLFYLFTSIIVLNLFIGIVTDVYPNARARSFLDWEEQITRIMRIRMERRYRSKMYGSVLQRLWFRRCNAAVHKPSSMHSMPRTARPEAWWNTCLFGCLTCRCCLRRTKSMMIAPLPISSPRSPTAGESASNPTNDVSWLADLARFDGPKRGKVTDFDAGIPSLDTMKMIADGLFNNQTPQVSSSLANDIDVEGLYTPPPRPVVQSQNQMMSPPSGTTPPQHLMMMSPSIAPRDRSGSDQSKVSSPPVNGMAQQNSGGRSHVQNSVLNPGTTLVTGSSEDKGTPEARMAVPGFNRHILSYHESEDEP